jgi:hypothetical protein
MAWGTYMLRKPFVSVIIRFRVKARESSFRFEMMHRTPGNPTTVNRVQQPAAPCHGGGEKCQKKLILPLKTGL